MPAQKADNKTAYFVQGDTAPALARCLVDGGGNPINLAGATVTISISYAMRQGGFVLFPRDLIVRNDPCVVDPDQFPPPDGKQGWVYWTPGELGSDTALNPSGRYLYTFEVTYQDGTHQTIPANTWLPMVVQPKIGGPLVNPGGGSSQTTSPQAFPPASGGS